MSNRRPVLRMPTLAGVVLNAALLLAPATQAAWSPPIQQGPAGPGPATAPATFSATVPAVPVPAENPISEAKRVLGKILFWDEQLSSDDTVACGTCHLPAAGGGDPRVGLHPGADGLFGTPDDVRGSPGMTRSDADNRYLPDPTFGLDVQVTGRSAPSYFDMTQFAPALFWDGRAGEQFVDPQTGDLLIASGAALESQAVGPILSAAEMGHDGRTWDQVLDKLEQVRPLRLASELPPDMAAAVAGDVGYPALFAAAFGDGTLSAARIGMAIATYERTLVPDQSPFDAFLAGDSGALTPGQLAGWNILQTQTLCLNCHVPPLFTDFGFHNLGLRPAAEDTGRLAVTGDPADLGAFKTPSLRNVGLKDALMHVGTVTDVPDALAFYNAPAFPQVSPAGHSQFTADQSTIPNPGGPPLPYTANNIPPQVVPPIADFLANALTDPRVASESFPFDRPRLHSELSPADPLSLGSGNPGLGGVVPRLIGRSPLVRGSPDFKLGLDGALGGSFAWLGLSAGSAPAGLQLKAGVPLHLDALGLLATLLVPVSGVGPGAGHATVQAAVPEDAAAAGLSLYGQWFVVDPGAAGQLAATAGVRWTVN